MSSLHPLVFSGPSGSGKSTLLQRLMKEYSGCFAFSVSRKLLGILTKCHRTRCHNIRLQQIRQYKWHGKNLSHAWNQTDYLKRREAFSNRNDSKQTFKAEKEVKETYTLSK